MLGNPELERALLEQTYDGVMTVTGTRKQEVGGETVCAVVFGHTGQQDRCKQQSDQLSGDDLLCA